MFLLQLRKPLFFVCFCFSSLSILSPFFSSTVVVCFVWFSLHIKSISTLNCDLQPQQHQQQKKYENSVCRSYIYGYSSWFFFSSHYCNSLMYSMRFQITFHFQPFFFLSFVDDFRRKIFQWLIFLWNSIYIQPLAYNGNLSKKFPFFIVCNTHIFLFTVN